MVGVGCRGCLPWGGVGVSPGGVGVSPLGVLSGGPAPRNKYKTKPIQDKTNMRGAGWALADLRRFALRPSQALPACEGVRP